MTSNSLHTCSSVSASSGKGSDSLAANLSCEATRRATRRRSACPPCGMRRRRSRKSCDFARAAGGHVPRVEVDHQLLAGGILEAPGPAARRGQREVGHLGPGFDLGQSRFQDFTGSSIASRFKRIAELHELLAQVRDVDAARHVDDHLHREHRRAGVGGRIAARGHFRDVDAAAWRRSPTDPRRCRVWSRHTTSIE